MQRKQATNFTDSLSARRELVELLDSEPLLGYLVQNSVVSQSLADQIKSGKSSAKQNLMLLKSIDDSGRNGVQLFLNSLRMTGQHYLANQLDDGQRIMVTTPTVPTGSSHPGTTTFSNLQLQTIPLYPLMATEII